ncbi:L,D-transpeptidase family protein [Shewanella cyperi]|uniref:L,D-transpeptidase family protein n=2 Tax=Shewanella cyperi TaxID=2814292 RepID=A0A975ALV1_9GAMM|nr:L,D-transpeptidase family protein [Shewanella cyperi]
MRAWLRTVSRALFCLAIGFTHPAAFAWAGLAQVDLVKVDLVKVDKSERKMVLLSGGQPVKTYRIALGANPQGHKQQEGDERTPEGLYRLDYKKEDSRFYRAMHISYPNAVDKISAKARGVESGGFIMVHGQRNWLGWLAPISQRFDWTDGCIALTNAEMDEFMALVDVGTEIQIEW